MQELVSHLITDNKKSPASIAADKGLHNFNILLI